MLRENPGTLHPTVEFVCTVGEESGLVGSRHLDVSTLNATHGLEVLPRKSGGGTDGNYFNARGIPCVALSTGMVDEHAASEHISIDDMVMAARVLTAIVTQPPLQEEEQ